MADPEIRGRLKAHYRTHPKAWRCQNGHPYQHPKREGKMSLFFGGGSMLIVFAACHHCNPISFQIGAIYNVKPEPMVFWYAVPDQGIFDEMRQMDDDGLPLETILDFLDTKTHPEAA